LPGCPDLSRLQLSSVLQAVSLRDVPRKTKAVKGRVVFPTGISTLKPSDGFSISCGGGDTQLARELRYTTIFILEDIAYA